LGVVVCGLFLLPVQALAQKAKWYQWFDREIAQRIEITGYRRLGYHNQRVSGDREAYDILEYGGLGNRTFTDSGAISLTGRKVLGLFNFQATILDSRLTDPQAQKFSLNYEKKGLAIDAGDIQGSLLNTNPFASFSKTLRGVSVGYRSGGFQAKIIRSQARGSARTVNLTGNNSVGPYYLQVSQIVNGSESVRVDGVEKTLGKDYIINYELGSITFLDQIISPTSSIVVSFEALGFNAREGVVQGAGASYDFGKYGRIGVTAMQQLARGSTGLSQRLEKFQGFGDASRAYILQFEPLDGQPFLIRVDGVEQVLGVDYVFDAATKSIFYFTRFMPFTSNIDVLYTPRPTTTADGDRENIGFDYRIPLGKGGGNGSLLLSQATGRLKSETNPTTGTARGARLDYRTGPLELRGSLRDVPSTFVTVETRGFGRNEKSSEWGATYSPKGKLKYALNGTNSSIENRQTRSDGTVTFLPARFTLLQGSVTYTPSESAMPWTLEHRRTQSTLTDRRTRLDSTSLATSRSFGRLDLKMDVQHQAGIGPIASGTEVTEGTIRLDSVRFGLGYSPTSKFNVQARTSLSAIEAGSQKGSGSDHSVTASYQPAEAWLLTGQYAYSDSGSLSTLGAFQSGFGFGYGGNGFSGGIGSEGAIGATNMELKTLNLSYNPSEKVTMAANVSSTRSSGSISSNSSTVGYGIGGTFNFGRGHSLSASLDSSRTSFVDSPLTSSATNIDFFLQGNPNPRLSYRIGVGILATGGNSEFKQDSQAFEGSITYILAPRHALNFSFDSGRLRGYYPQDNLSYGLTYQYRIWQSMSLNVSYRIRDIRNIDPTVTSGAYRASGFDFELSFNFGR